MRLDTAEEVLAELSAGIIPIQMFYSKISKNLDPFENISKKDSIRLKRKWRKLKKKYGVKNAGLASAAFRIKKGLIKSFEDEKLKI